MAFSNRNLGTQARAMSLRFVVVGYRTVTKTGWHSSICGIKEENQKKRRGKLKF